MVKMMIVGYVFALFIMIYYIYRPHLNAFTTLGWKTCSSLCFLTIGILWMLMNHHTFGTWMVVGLFMGLMGDVFLNLTPCYPKKETLWFLLGLGSFLIGHLAYVYALYRTSILYSVLLIIGCAFVSFILLLFLQRKNFISLQEMFLPAFVYATVILFFEMQCLVWLFDQIQVFTIVLNIGSMLFVLSDLILLFILFGDKDTKTMTRMNLTTYYLAQMCLATTILLYKA